MDTIATRLDHLYRAQTELGLLRAEVEAKKHLAMPAEVVEALSKIDIEYEERIEEETDKVSSLTRAIQADVLSLSASVKGDYLQAVYSKGRTTWETKALDGYAAAHPELNEFRKTGEPSVSIRPVKTVPGAAG